MPYCVQIPNALVSGEFITWGWVFKSRAAAVRAFREAYGQESIDDEGHVQVISSYEEDEK